MMRLVILLVLISACSQSKTDKGPALLERVRTEKAVTVVYYDLVRAYESNEVAADAKYKGTVLSVPGVIQSVTKEGNQTIIGIAGPEANKLIRCVYGGSGHAGELDVINLSRGMGVEVHGIGDGAKSGEPVLTACVVRP